MFYAYILLCIWHLESTWIPGKIGTMIWLCPHQKKKYLDSRWTPENHLESSGVQPNYVGQCKDLYFIVQFFLKTMAEDPFEKYPVLQSLLWSQDLGQLVVIKPQDVNSHFAGLSLMWCGARCLAVISLSRVTTICSELKSSLIPSYRNINYHLVAQHFFRTLSLPCLLKLLTLFFHSTYFKI